MAFTGHQPEFKRLDLTPASGTTNIEEGSIHWQDGTHVSFDNALYVYDGAANVRIDIDTLAELTDFSNAGAVDGKVVAYNGSSYVLEAITIGDQVTGALNDLSDVSTAGASTSGQAVMYNGVSYIVSALELNNLSDMNTASASDGKVIAHNGSSFVMESLTLADQVTGQLEDLSDIDSATNSPLTTANLPLLSDGDGTYSFAAMDLSTNVGGDIGDLDNVSVAGATSGDAVVYNGSTFAMQAVATDFTVSTKTTNFTAVDKGAYLCDTSGGVVSGTLPSAVAGSRVVFKDKGSALTNNLVILTPAAETIDGAASLTIESDYASVQLTSDGTNWFIL